jgi:Holliday junction DNA helicase RuvA
MTTLYDFPEVGETLVLHTHLSIREDAHQLFGFLHEIDRRLFRELIKVNGIGGRSALSILSGMNAADFVECILSENIALLIKIPGIGKKTAERLLIEMRDRLKEWKIAGTLNPSLASSGKALQNTVQEEAISALIALGYRPQVASKMLEGCYNAATMQSAEDLIREALELYEDAYWAQLAEERWKTFDRKTALTHEQVWGRRPKKRR